ncbi:phage repressor protein [Paenibacillus alvei]|nr:phage repressor protein [Paenibacillus alvei]
MRVENWNGCDIRFIEKEPNDWWAVAADVTKALGLKQVTRALSGLKDGVTTSKVGVKTGEKRDGSPAMQEIDMNIINEKSIYKLVFKSKKKEAEAFQDWVFDIIKALRQSTGLEGFQIFRMLDKDHQREAMRNLSGSLRQPVRRDFIKANTIADKAVSSKFGHPKMLKKNQMTPDMLVARQPILEDTVSLMSMVDHFKLDLSVSKTIYEKHA